MPPTRTWLTCGALCAASTVAIAPARAGSTVAVAPAPAPAHAASTVADSDAVLDGPLPAGKRAVLETNLVSPIVGLWGVSLELMPAEHHALVLSGAFVHGTRSSNPQVQPALDGFGFEVGYRQYSGRRGPRGLFAGPSLLLGGYRLSPPDSATASNVDLFSVGGAFDVGYQAIVGDVAIALGAGVQYTHPSKDVPLLAYPATIYANGGLRPRALVSIGYAF